jgi:hypothetical protein
MISRQMPKTIMREPLLFGGPGPSGARRVANPLKGSARAEVKSRRLVAATAKICCSDGWSAWSATVQKKPYSLVRIIAMLPG